MPSDPERFDYFISYAHDDDRPPRGESAGWVSVFMEGLESALKKLGLRDGFNPFTDRSTLRGADDLDQQIIDALSRTDLLITLLSPSYFSSKYCMREQEIFVSKNGLDASIIVAELDRPSEDDMAGLSFKNRRGIQFWTRGEGGYTMPMAYPVPQPTDRDFYQRIYELALEVAESIKARRKAAALAPAPVPAAVAVPSQSHVVVAEVTEDLDKRREQVVWRLKDAGHPHTVLDSYGMSTEDFVAQIDGNLAGATHFVQLLGSHAGRARPGAPNGFSRLQYDRAQSRADRLQIMQWRDPVLDPKNFDDLQFRDLLEMPTVQAVSFDKFKETFFAGLRAVPTAAPATATIETEAGGQKHVFVNYDERDAKFAETIFNELDSDIMAFGPPPADTDEEYREKVQEELTSCDGMMIVFGDSGSKWVHARLAEFSKVIPKRKSMLKNLFVLRTVHEQSLPPVRLPGLKVIDWQEGKSLQELGVSFS